MPTMSCALLRPAPSTSTALFLFAYCAAATLCIAPPAGAGAPYCGGPYCGGPPAGGGAPIPPCGCPGGYPEAAVLIGGGPPITWVGGVRGVPAMGLCVRPTEAGAGE